MILRRMTRWRKVSGRRSQKEGRRSQPGQGKHPHTGGIPTDVGQTLNEGRHTSNWLTRSPLRGRVELIAINCKYMKYKEYINDINICNTRYSKYVVPVIAQSSRSERMLKIVCRAQVEAA